MDEKIKTTTIKDLDATTIQERLLVERRIRITIMSNIGNILIKDITAIFNDFFAFFLSLISAMIKNIIAIKLIIIIVMFIKNSSITSF